MELYDWRFFAALCVIDFLMPFLYINKCFHWTSYAQMSWKKPTMLNDWMLFISSCLCLDIQTKIANPTLYVTSPLLPCLYILRHFTNHRRHCKDLFLAIKMIKSPININMWNWLMHIDEEITCCLYDFRFGNDDCRAELLPLRWRQFSMYTIFNRQNMQWGH